MRGGAAAEAGMEAEQHQPARSGHHLQQATAPKSPPLSAAPSQASLSGSDRSPSDPELMSRASSSVSLASTSRPASASPAPHLSTDISRAVEEEDEDAVIPNGYAHHTSSPASHTSSPASHTSSPASHTSSPAPHTSSPAPHTNGPASLTDGPAPHTAPARIDEPLTIPDLDDDDGPESLTGLDSRDSRDLLRVENGMDGPNSDVEEEYFEEYHLPNTHENAFVRHLSFRRKVEGTPINAPDAEKIEGLVRNGEFERHGSMRRKIVPAADTLYRLEEDSPSKGGRRGRGPRRPQVQEFGDDFREIEKMMDGDGDEEEGDYGLNGGDQLRFDDEGNAINPRGNAANTDTPKLLMRGKNAYTSTPNAPYASTADYASIDLSVSLHDNTGSRRESTDDHLELESLSIEQSTLTKVRECMDFSKCKDIYSITGKLQDMLTAVEVEEVLNNSHRYMDVIDTGVLEALFNSVSEQMSMTGQPMSISFNKSDTKKPVEEKKVMTLEEVELRRNIRQKLLMEELAMDSLPYLSVQPGEERRDVIPQEASETDIPAVVMRKKKGSTDGSDGEGSRYSTIERRKSVKVSAGHNQMEVEGVFIESDFKDSKLKTIPAPTIDLMNTQDDLDLTDMEESRSWSADDDQEAGEENRSTGRRNSLAPHHLMDDGSFEISVPSIRITRTESSREHDDNSSVNNLYVDETTDVSSFYCIEDEDIKVCRPSDGDHSGDVLQDHDSVFERVSNTPQTYVDAESLGAPALPAELEGGAEEERHWRSVVIGGVWRRIDMKVIAPYQKCISAGAEHNGFAVIVVSACCLPERSRPDYAYVMDNLFLYLLSRLEQLVTAEDYILVYLSGGRNVAQTGPGFHWLKAAYRMIDRKLRKNLHALLVVHPTLWVRTVVALTRPFISSKFYRKLTFVYSLTELAQLIPLHQLQIPESVQQADFELMIREKKRNVARRPRPAGFRR